MTFVPGQFLELPSSGGEALMNGETDDVDTSVHCSSQVARAQGGWHVRDEFKGFRQDCDAGAC